MGGVRCGGDMEVGASFGLLNVHATCRVYEGRLSGDNCTCCHSEIEVADQTCYLTQQQHIDPVSISPGTDLITLDV